MSITGIGDLPQDLSQTSYPTFKGITIPTLTASGDFYQGFGIGFDPISAPFIHFYPYDIIGLITLADGATSTYMNLSNFSVSTVGITSKLIFSYGKNLSLKENGGSNPRAGVATLVAGTVTISNNSVGADTRIIISPQNTSGTAGNLSITRNAGVSFTINSSSALDTRDIYWELKDNYTT